jgi:hypothetical protein
MRDRNPPRESEREPIPTPRACAAESSTASPGAAPVLMVGVEVRRFGLEERLHASQDAAHSRVTSFLGRGCSR